MNFPRLSALFVSAGLGTVLFATGCPGPEASYYCDATGCFNCDGYGCKPVAAPSKPVCTGNQTCATGSVCTDKGCAVVCSNDAVCPRGEVCTAGLCAAPATKVEKKECTTTPDCGASSVCVANKCQACGGTNGPCPCADDSNCGTGLKCVANACTAEKNRCEFSSECGDGRVCANNQCVASCESAACPATTKCVAGACVPDGLSNCQNDTQCGGNTPKCVAGNCVAACTTDAVCGAGKFCDQGACVIDTRPETKCRIDSECTGTSGNGQSCIGGFCKYRCTTDTYCRSVDSRIGYCAADLVCRNQTEAQAECTLSLKCAAGKSCIANRCL